MHIQSINIAQTHQLRVGTETRSTGIVKTPVSGPIHIGKLGLDGDYIANEKVHGGEDQAVYLYAAEDNLWWSEKLGQEIAPGTFGENLTLAGFDSREVHIGDRLVIGDLVLELSGPRMPCATLAARMGNAAFVKEFFAALRPGAYARVISEGTVCLGDEVEWLKTTQDFAQSMDVFTQWNAKQKSAEVLAKILASPVSSLQKDKLEQWYAALT